MSQRNIKNIGASVRNRLLNKAKSERQTFNHILQRYAMERVLYRLSVSEYADLFYLKGALLFWVWDMPERRATMDIDLLGFVDNSLDAVKKIFRTICTHAVQDDGLLFDLDSLQAERIKEDADYEGVRIRFRARLDTAKITLQVDIGFDDLVEPYATKQRFPVLLDMPAPQIKCYPAQTVIAEKFEAMIKLDRLNSRMKDFYDIWLLSRQYQFELQGLQRACHATFKKRGTECSLNSSLFGDDMLSDPNKQRQWKAFYTKSGLSSCPESFSQLLEELLIFLTPLAHAILSDKPKQGHWPPCGPWKYDA